MKMPPSIIMFLNSYFRFVAAGAILLVLILGYLFLLSPKVTTVQTGQVTAQKSAETDLQNKEAHAQSLRDSNAKFHLQFPPDRLKTIDDFLPAEPDFPKLLLLIKDLVAQSQLTLNSFTLSSPSTGSVGAASLPPGVSAINPAESAPPVGVQSVDMTISVSGGSSYESFKNLLANFEASQPLLDVESVNFSSVAPSTGNGTSSAAATTWTFTLRTYFLPNK